MAESEATKGSSTGMGGTSSNSSDDQDRVGGDIKTRNAGQPGGSAGRQGEDEETAGRERPAEDDPVRGA